MANPHIGECDLFINIWVDTNAVVSGSARGVYVVDSRGSRHAVSQNAGTVLPMTRCTTGSRMCWQAFSMNPDSGDSVRITAISNSGAWGDSGQPKATLSPPAFTGVVQTAGVSPYTVSLAVQRSGSSFPLTATLGISAKEGARRQRARSDPRPHRIPVALLA